MLDSRSRVFFSTTCSLLVSASALAQGGADPKASPLDAATASKADAPATVEAKPKLNDPEIEKLMGSLTGSFAADAAGDTPALRLNSAAMDIAGLDNAVYFEISRADSPATPFRQGVFHAYRHKNELRLRIFDFAGTPGLKDIMTAMWAAPEAMPKLAVESLDPNLDLVLTASGQGWNGTTVHAYPTARDGAVEMTATMSIVGGGGGGELRMSDAGFAADGLQVWGTSSSGGPVFKKSAAGGASVKRTEDGLIVITLVAPSDGGPKLVENGQVSVHYTGWLPDGSRFDSSRLPGRDPFTLRVPGAVIKGWNEGLKEIAKGERRRLVIPAAMAYGERGTRDGRIPPNSTLIFDVECVYLDNATPTPPPQTSPVPMSPHGAAPSGTPPTPPTPPPHPTPPPQPSGDKPK
jgi:hypothetical protein